MNTHHAGQWRTCEHGKQFSSVRTAYETNIVGEDLRPIPYSAMQSRCVSPCISLLGLNLHLRAADVARSSEYSKVAFEATRCCGARECFRMAQPGKCTMVFSIWSTTTLHLQRECTSQLASSKHISFCGPHCTPERVNTNYHIKNNSNVDCTCPSPA